MEYCGNCFMNMNMLDENSCRENLQEVKKTLNVLLCETKELNKAWLESFLFQVFFQQFSIKQQAKVAGTSKKKGRRFWKVMDFCAIRSD